MFEDVTEKGTKNETLVTNCSDFVKIRIAWGLKIYTVYVGGGSLKSTLRDEEISLFLVFSESSFSRLWGAGEEGG